MAHPCLYTTRCMSSSQWWRTEEDRRREKIPTESSPHLTSDIMGKGRKVGRLVGWVGVVCRLLPIEQANKNWQVPLQAPTTTTTVPIFVYGLSSNKDCYQSFLRFAAIHPHPRVLLPLLSHSYFTGCHLCVSNRPQNFNWFTRSCCCCCSECQSLSLLLFLWLADWVTKCIRGVINC